MLDKLTQISDYNIDEGVAIFRSAAGYTD